MPQQCCGATILALLAAALVLPASAQGSGTPAPAGILTAAGVVSAFPMSLRCSVLVRARGTVCSWAFARL
jgi:uncharacterized lipoprotein YbaY